MNNRERDRSSRAISRYGKNIYLLLLSSFTGVLLYYRLSLQIARGPIWDTYAFLANALEFAGKGLGYTELHRPPLLSFITSLFFRAGWMSETVIFLVDAAFLFAGTIGLYLLLKLRFTPLQSFAGALLFLSLPPVLQWATQGYTDIASVTLSIWTVYFLVLAVERDKRYYFPAFPLLLLAMLTRFTAILMIFPFGIYLLLRANILRDLKQISQGLLATILMSIPYFLFYGWRMGDPLYQLKIAFGVTVRARGTEQPPDNWTQLLSTLPSYVASGKIFGFPISYLILGVSLAGILLYLSRYFARARKPVAYYLILLGSFAMFVALFNKTSYLMSETIFAFCCLLLYKLFKGEQEDKFELDILFLSWLFTYLIFHADSLAAESRYFIPLAPALVYFAVLGWGQIIPSRRVDGEIRRNSSPQRTWRVLSPALTVLFCLLIATSIPYTLGHLPRGENPYNTIVAEATQWLKTERKDLSSARIYSDLWPLFSWRLELGVRPMPFFKDDRGFEHELLKQDADYYLSTRQLNLSAYEKVHTAIATGENEAGYRERLISPFVSVFKRNREVVGQPPRLLYIGKNWENYLEEILDFEVFLISGKSTFIDDYQPETLRKYPAVLLYNFKWHDRKKAESLLERYVLSGGKVFIDTSSNVSGSYSLDGDILFGTSIQMKSAPRHPEIAFSPPLSGSPIEFSPFLSDGDPWYGTTYMPLADQASFKNLVTVGDDTLIGKQVIGKGEICWLGYNLIWHAFRLKNKDEKRLIQKVFELAISGTK